MNMLNFIAHPVGKKQNNKWFLRQNYWGSKTFKIGHHKPRPPSILKVYNQHYLYPPKSCNVNSCKSFLWILWGRKGGGGGLVETKVLLTRLRGKRDWLISVL